MKRTRWIVSGIVLVVWAGLWVGCGSDSGTDNGGNTAKPVSFNGALIVPAAWAGTWQVTMTMRDCTTNAIVGVEDVTSQLCPGDTLVNPFVPIFENCTGTRTGNHLEADCSYNKSVGTCQVTVHVTLKIDVDGNTLSGSGKFETTATPGCGAGLLASDCEKVTITGTRTSSSTAGCDSLTTSRRPFVR